MDTFAEGSVRKGETSQAGPSASMDEIPVTSMLAIDPHTLSLGKLRLFSKNIAFQIQRLENARGALMESISGHQQAQADSRVSGLQSGVSGATQRVRSMEVLLTQLTRFHRECLLAGKEKRMDTLSLVTSRAQEVEAKYLITSTEHCAEVCDNQQKELKFRLEMTKDKNMKHQEKVNAIYWTKQDHAVEEHNHLLERIAKGEERQQRRAAEIAIETEQKRERREQKRQHNAQRLVERDRRVEAEQEKRAKSALERTRVGGDSGANVRGMVRQLLEAGSDGVLREKTMAQQRAALAPKVVKTPEPSSTAKNTRFGQSSSFARLTKEKPKTKTIVEVEEDLLTRLDEVKKWKDHELDTIKEKNRAREEKSDEHRWEAHNKEMSKIESIKNKQLDASKRLAERQQAQGSLAEKMILQRQSHRERARAKAEAALPAIDRWEDRANSILANVCADLTSDFNISKLDPSTLKPGFKGKKNTSSAMDSLSRPSKGFESWR